MNSLSVCVAIRDRRSVRRFRPDPLPHGLLDELLATATHAPNHHRTEPWRFAIVEGEAKDRLADLRVELMRERSAQGGRPMRDPGEIRGEITVPPVIVYVVQHLDPDVGRRHEDYASCAIVAYILQLAAWEHGIGARWHTGMMAMDPRVAEFLGLPADEAVFGYVALGYPQDAPPVWQRTPAAELTRRLSHP